MGDEKPKNEVATVWNGVEKVRADKFLPNYF